MSIAPKRKAFTLVELLVVISIIGVLTGMFLVAYRGADQESSTQKTRSTIQKISDVLNARMEEYSSYPIVLRLATVSGQGQTVPLGATPFANNNPVEQKTILLERARLLCLREIIAMEMPDHPDDIKWSDKWVTAPNNIITFMSTVPKPLSTGMSFGAVRNPVTSRVIGLARKLSVLGPNGYSPIPGWQNRNANAELLYLVVEDSQLDGTSALESFGASEIGDTDGDGLNEFVDGFGRPIQWIRWPTGYGEGITRYNPDMLAPGMVSGTAPNYTIAMESDPLDRIKADPGYAAPTHLPGPGVFPLVVSAGIDRRFGIRFQLNDADRIDVGGKPSYSVTDAPWTSATPAYFNAPPRYKTFTDPWYPRNAADAGRRLGGRLTTGDTPVEFDTDPVSPNNARDNITNYDGNGAAL